MLQRVDEELSAVKARIEAGAKLGSIVVKSTQAEAISNS